MSHIDDEGLRDAIESNELMIAQRKADITAFQEELGLKSARMEDLQRRVDLLRGQGRGVERIPENYRNEKAREETNEQYLKRLQAEVADLERTYTRERQSRESLSRRLYRKVQHLENELNARSSAGLQEREVPLQSLRNIKELDKHREKDLQVCLKEHREMEAMINLKSRRVVEIEDEHAKEMEQAIKLKDEQIMKIHEDIHNERNKLLSEIEELKRANIDSSLYLKKGGVPPQNKQELALVLKKGGSRDDRAPHHLRLQSQRGKEMKNEREALLDQEAKLKIDAEEWMQKAKQEKVTIESEKKGYARELAKLDKHIAKEKALQQELLEKHNLLKSQADQVNHEYVRMSQNYERQEQKYLMINDTLPEDIQQRKLALIRKREGGDEGEEYEETEASDDTDAY